MIQHIVLFNPRTDLTSEERRGFARSVVDTLKMSPHITRCTVGRHSQVDAGYSRSFGDKTYEYAAVLEFKNRDLLVSYLRDPQHEKIGQAFWTYCASTVVCEVESAVVTDEGLVDLLVEQ